MYPYAHCTRVFCWGKSIVPVIQLYDLSQKIILKWHLLAHQRHATHINSVSITQQFYNRLPIRKKYIRAIKRGTLIYDRGQIKIPPIKIEGYDLPKKCQPPNYQGTGRIYKGRFENIRAKRICFAD